MSFIHVDTSTIVKRYVPETGSAWVRTLVDPASNNAISMAEITRAEVASAVARRVRDGTLTPSEASLVLSAFASHCASEYRRVPTDPAVVDRAIDLLQRHTLRAYDAIQLSTALSVNESLVAGGLPTLTFVTADDDLIAAAQAEALTVDNPNWHP